MEYLDKIRLIAEVLIAICAVGGFMFAIYQNIQSRKLFDRAADAFLAQSYPIVKYQSYGLIGPEISSGGLPTGINVFYQNYSKVPVSLEIVTVKIYLADEQIFNDPNRIFHDLPGEKILAPDQISATGYGDTKFPDIYKNLGGLGDNKSRINVDLDITYRSLITEKRYNYKAKINLFEDPRFPQQRLAQVGEEKIVEL